MRKDICESLISELRENIEEIMQEKRVARQAIWHQKFSVNKIIHLRQIILPLESFCMNACWENDPIRVEIGEKSGSKCLLFKHQ